MHVLACSGNTLLATYGTCISRYCTCGIEYPWGTTSTYMYMSLYTCVHVPTDNVQMSAFSYQSREVSSGEYNTSRVI